MRISFNAPLFYWNSISQNVECRNVFHDAHLRVLYCLTVRVIDSNAAITDILGMNERARAHSRLWNVAVKSESCKCSRSQINTLPIRVQQQYRGRERDKI